MLGLIFGLVCGILLVFGSWVLGYLLSFLGARMVSRISHVMFVTVFWLVFAGFVFLDGTNWFFVINVTVFCVC